MQGSREQREKGTRGKNKEYKSAPKNCHNANKELLIGLGERLAEQLCGSAFWVGQKGDDTVTIGDDAAPED